MGWRSTRFLTREQIPFEANDLNRKRLPIWSSVGRGEYLSYAELNPGVFSPLVLARFPAAISKSSVQFSALTPSTVFEQFCFHIISLCVSYAFPLPKAARKFDYSNSWLEIL